MIVARCVLPTASSSARRQEEIAHDPKERWIPAGSHAAGHGRRWDRLGRAARGEFDCVIACYHDQGLIPVKLLAFGKAVNVTLGLPIVRTSVDHGTAFDIAGKGIADPSSLIEAVKLAARLVVGNR